MRRTREQRERYGTLSELLFLVNAGVVRATVFERGYRASAGSAVHTRRLANPS